MSSDDGIDYHKSLQHHHHHHQPISQQAPLSVPSTSSSCSLPVVNVNGSNATIQQHQHQHQHQPTQTNSASLGTGTVARRKSSLTYQHHLQHEGKTSQATETLGLNVNSNSMSNGAGCGSGSGGGVNSSGTGYVALASPGRYNIHQPEGYHHIGGRLSLHPIERYEDTMTCCLPPPSPAPTSDRFVMGIPSPSPMNTSNHSNHSYSSQQSQQTVTGNQHKYSNTSTMHRTMSPSSRIRMSERYRDASPKCDRFVTTTHFLANSTPLVSNDTYTYLSSTVHTPVKRYVPTPPPPTEIYSDIPQSSSSTSSSSGYHTIGGNAHLPQQQQNLNQHQNMNTLPYRFRMKCCLTEPAAPTSLPAGHLNSYQDRVTVADHYATPPRVRPLKCPSNGVQNPISMSANMQQQVSSVPTAVLIPQNARQPRTASSMVNDYMPRTPSVEYLGAAGGRVVTPVSVLSEPSAGTCLHCNTIRRTTGVHQTTQTTGPISPIPQQQSLSLSSTTMSGVSASQLDSGGSEMNSTSPTPSMNHSQASPLSPLTQSSHQDQNEQHHPCGSQQSKQSASATIISSHSSLASRALQHSQQQHHHHTQQVVPQSMNHALTRHHHNAISSTNNNNNSSSINNGSSNNNNNANSSNSNNNSNNNSNANMLPPTSQRSTLTIRQQMQQRFSRKQRLKEYVRREIAKFFGVDSQSEDEQRVKWYERQRRLALRRFGPLKTETEMANDGGNFNNPQQPATDRPDILPAQTTDDSQSSQYDTERYTHILSEKKASVPTMIVSGLSYIIQTLNKRQLRVHKQWSRSFAPAQAVPIHDDNPNDVYEGISNLNEDEVFFDTPGNDLGNPGGSNAVAAQSTGRSVVKLMDHPRQIYMGERVQGWRTSAVGDQQHHQQQPHNNPNNGPGAPQMHQRMDCRGNRISSHLLDGVLDNSHRPVSRSVKLFRTNELDDRNDHRPFFTYWINTVQILVLVLSLICYGIGPIGIGVEQKSGQVLVTSLSLQTVQHQEQRNVWIGPRINDLVHLGAKFAACMRRDAKIMDVISKTRRQERETACCIRNDDSGCVQSSQADCSVRGLWPTKSISTWKKWSPGESGPGGRISGSVCGLDPKYCDAPASIAPYEWPDDITKWPICRKTNSFSQRFRFKDHTAEHMVCEVIGHPCCTGVFGECRITTREYCDFVNGYFHEEASLCSQVSCLNNVCGMFPFISTEVPDQFYRLFTSLCLHAGILHLAITVAFQHVFLADLERLIGPIRTAIVYIGSGLAGNLTSAILVPYKPEVGPLASLAGVVSSLGVLLLLIHWKQLKKPHIALIKLVLVGGTLFGMGTLPWQQNFTGLLAGVLCGIFLTIALVPFVTISKYGRKSKINLVWTCLLFHLLLYTIMVVIFYIFPTEFTSFNFGDVLNSGMGPNGIDNTAIGSGMGHSSNQQHHHHLDDMVRNVNMGKSTSNAMNTNLNIGNIGPFSSTFEGVKAQQISYRHHILDSNSKPAISCVNGVCLARNDNSNDPANNAIVKKSNSDESRPGGKTGQGGTDANGEEDLSDGILSVSNAINQHVITA